jgi:hypothetical protein
MAASARLLLLSGNLPKGIYLDGDFLLLSSLGYTLPLNPCALASVPEGHCDAGSIFAGVQQEPMDVCLGMGIAVLHQFKTSVLGSRGDTPGAAFSQNDPVVCGSSSRLSGSGCH